VTHPNDCGCCSGITREAPVSIFNRPGLSAIAYRIGTHSRFKASMLTALSNPKTRDDTDFTIALLDGAAVIADVLTFYQERLANELFLRTATERRSILELARLIGYALHPGVAGSTALAFTLDDAVGAPRRTVIDIGTRVQSIPGPGDKPQTFETIEKLDARIDWNALRPRLTQPQPISTTMSSILIKGIAKLAKGDALLIVAADSSGTVFRKLRRVASVKEENAKQQTAAELLPLPRHTVADTAVVSGGIRTAIARMATTNNEEIQNHVLNESWNASDLNAFGLKRGLSPDQLYQVIGSNYRSISRPPNTGVFAMRKRAALFGSNAPVWQAMPNSTRRNYGDASLQLPDWAVSGFQGNTNTTLYLDQIYKEVRPDDWVIVSRPGNEDVIAQITNAHETAAAWFAISGQVTAITLNTSANLKPASMDDLRRTHVYIVPEELTSDELPEKTAVQKSPIQLDGPVEGLAPGQTIIVSGTRHDADGVNAAETAIIREVRLESGYTTLGLNSDLQYPYVRESVRINANIARATHGETVQEVLGGGDAGTGFQTFKLKQPPLTHTSAANADGIESTLEIRVNDLLWREVPSLYGRTGKDHVYIARQDDDGNTTLQFGDGRTGSRLPSIQNNIQARYRKGIGMDGLVKAGQLNMLLTRPLGVKGVTNPQAATGAQDPEHLDDARDNAPLHVLTLERVVSLNDYESFARTFAGISKALATWTWDGRSRNVLLTVAGPNGAPVEPGTATYENLIAALRSAGDPFVELGVKTYRPATFRMEGNVKVDGDFESDKVLDAVKGRLRDTFGFASRDFSQPVMLSEVIAVVQAVDGVAAVDIDRLYRSDTTPGLQRRLLADRPLLSTNGQLLAAELLTLDTVHRIELGVME
jgi:predicted phage baseplate assembly protein